MTVMRCCTILDKVLRRRTIMDEVARHCRTTIAHYRTVSIDVARCRVTSYGIARSSCDIPHERESQQDFEHDQKLPIHLEIECNVVHSIVGRIRYGLEQKFNLPERFEPRQSKISSWLAKRSPELCLGKPECGEY